MVRSARARQNLQHASSCMQNSDIDYLLTNAFSIRSRKNNCQRDVDRSLKVALSASVEINHRFLYYASFFSDFSLCDWFPCSFKPICTNTIPKKIYMRKTSIEY